MDDTRNARARLQEKEAFYKTFEALEHSDDDDTSDSFLTHSRETSLGSKILEKPANEHLKHNGPDQATTSIQRKTDKAATTDQPVQPPPSAVPRAIGKRKRGDEIKLVPEGQRLFRNLHFYFFPNNDTGPVRRLRIIKAIEFGASWQTNFNPFVTHIIVDGSLTYQELLKFLKVIELPHGMAVVTENWPSDCLSHGHLLDPGRMVFRVKGAPTTTNEAEETTKTVNVVNAASASQADRSLELKPVGRFERVREPSTPVSTSHGSARRVELLEAEPGVDVEQPDNLEQSTAVNGLPDEFQVVISEARQLNELPFDDELSDSRPSSSSGVLAKDVDVEKQLTTAKRQATWHDKFQCMNPHTAAGTTVANEQTIKVLQQMADYYQQTGDEWRIRAYRKAIATLRNHPYKISTKEQALALPNVGERLADKIEEIAVTHRLRRLDHAMTEPSDHAIQLFLRIYGVGTAQASAWVRQGFTSFDDLLTKAKLTTNQRIGVEHLEDFSLRIPRAEVKQHGDIVTESLQRVDPLFSVTIGGSYRRGSQDSGDIDCIITHPNLDINKMRVLIIDKLIAPLFKQGFLKAELSAMSRNDGSKWHGASCLPGSQTWRRLDFLLVPADELGAAMIYFTGNDIFNRSIRLLASKKGLRLNQHGLYENAIRGKNRERVTVGTLLEGRDEKRIFEILGVPWREPWERLI